MAAKALVQTEAEAAAREVRAHGCCCQGCKLIWELYFAIGLDILICDVRLKDRPRAVPNVLQLFTGTVGPLDPF